MRANKNSPAHAGIRYETTDSTDLISFKPQKSQKGPDGHACPFSRSSRARCWAWEAGGLSPALRCFAEHHNWHEPGHISNQLKLRLAFKKPVRVAVHELLARGRDGLAAKIEANFSKLQEKIQSLEQLCVKRFNEEDELVMLEHTKGHLAEGLFELADLIESADKPRKTRKGSQRPGKLNPQGRDAVAGLEKTASKQWIGLKEAGEMVGKHPATIGRWVQNSKVRDNGKKGQDRRVRKTDILLIKQAAEEKDLKKDVQNLRKDVRAPKGDDDSVEQPVLTDPELTLLIDLQKNVGTSRNRKTIVHRTDISDGAMKTMLKRFEELGIVHRPNGERMGYTITAAGTSLHNKHYPTPPKS